MAQPPLSPPMQPRPPADGRLTMSGLVPLTLTAIVRVALFGFLPDPAGRPGWTVLAPDGGAATVMPGASVRPSAGMRLAAGEAAIAIGAC